MKNVKKLLPLLLCLLLLPLAAQADGGLLRDKNQPTDARLCTGESLQVVFDHDKLTDDDLRFTVDIMNGQLITTLIDNQSNGTDGGRIIIERPQMDYTIGAATWDRVLNLSVVVPAIQFQNNISDMRGDSIPLLNAKGEWMNKGLNIDTNNVNTLSGNYLMEQLLNMPQDEALTEQQLQETGAILDQPDPEHVPDPESATLPDPVVSGSKPDKPQTGDVIYNIPNAAGVVASTQTGNYAYTPNTRTLTMTDVPTITYDTIEGFTVVGWKYSDSTGVIEKLTDYAPTSGTVGTLKAEAAKTRNSHSVTYSDGVNAAPYFTDEAVHYAYAVPQPDSDPVREGYTFAGWSPSVPAAMPDRALTFTAQWTKNSYTLTVRVGVASTAYPYEYGATITPPADPAVSGKKFVAWEPDIPATMPASDVTVTAVFKDIFKVITKVEGVSPDMEYSFAVGEKVLIGNPVREGFAFKGWTPALPDIMPGHSVTVQAEFEKSYTITYVANGEVYAKASLFAGAPIVPPAPPSKTGHSFTAWDPIVPDVMPAEDITVTAAFAVNSYRMTWVADVVTSYKDYAYGAAVEKRDDPKKTGYTFTGWDKAIPATMPAENVTATAQFAVNQYDFITVIDGVSTAKKYDYGAAIAKPADPSKTGYTFTGWDKAIPATMPSENITVTAAFTVNSYNLIVIADGTTYPGIPYHYGAEIAPVTAPEKEGYEFEKWDSAFPATMPAHDVTVTAVYKAKTFNIITDIAGEDFPPKYPFACDAPVTGVADPTLEGHRFTGWSPALPATMPAHDVEVTAQFERLSYTVTTVVEGVSPNAVYTFAYDNTVTGIPTPSKEGYSVSWSPALPEYMPAENITVTAVFTELPQ